MKQRLKFICLVASTSLAAGQATATLSVFPRLTPRSVLNKQVLTVATRRAACLIRKLSDASG